MFYPYPVSLILINIINYNANEQFCNYIYSYLAPPRQSVFRQNKNAHVVYHDNNLVVMAMIRREVVKVKVDLSVVS